MKVILFMTMILCMTKYDKYYIERNIMYALLMNKINKESRFFKRINTNNEYK